MKPLSIEPGLATVVSRGDPWDSKNVLVTGVAGTVGGEVARQLAECNVRSMIGIDNNESALFFVEHRFSNHRNFSFALADIFDMNSLIALMEGVDIVIHAAALKHVSICETAPRSAIRTNILGTQNVIQAASQASVERVLFTSSDKAVNPTNVMGTSKLMAERLITAANAQSRSGRTIFGSSRFGNVLGSRGSVIPLFKQQIAAGGPLTLTDPTMTRFIMTLTDAVKLVMHSVFLLKGGEVFVTKMPVCRIEDLAIVMIEELAPAYGHDPKDIEIKHIGPKPGEKFYEELMNEEEIRRALELEEHFVIVPALKSNNVVEYEYPGMANRRPALPYNSKTAEPMSREALRGFLLAHQFLDG